MVDFLTQPTLFTVDSDSTESEDIRVRVALAYAQCAHGSSVDRILADPDLASHFHRTCWYLKVPRSPARLNRILLNARKAGLLANMVARPSLPNLFLDPSIDCGAALAFAGLRKSVGERITVDDLLVDPTLRREFDEFAQSICPDASTPVLLSSLLRQRKARKSIPNGLKYDRQLWFDWFSDELPSESIVGALAKLRNVSGLYQVHSKMAGVLYVGAANSLASLSQTIFAPRSKHLAFLGLLEGSLTASSLEVELVDMQGTESAPTRLLRAAAARAAFSDSKYNIAS